MSTNVAVEKVKKIEPQSQRDINRLRRKLREERIREYQQRVENVINKK